MLSCDPAEAVPTRMPDAASILISVFDVMISVPHAPARRQSHRNEKPVEPPPIAGIVH